MTKLATFGEVMMRISPPNRSRLIQALPGSVDITFAGAEGNVASTFSLLGGDAKLLTAVPDNPVAAACLASYRRLGVDTSGALHVPDSRLGVFFVENGSDQRPSSVTYDRRASAIAVTSSDRYDWHTLLDGCGWLHVTGITPAVSEEAAAATLEAVKSAKNLNLQVSCDLNFRSKLWDWKRGVAARDLAREVMGEILNYVDLVVGNEADAEDVLGIRAGITDVDEGVLDVRRYPQVAREISKRFPNVSLVAITLRESLSASHNRWGAVMYDCRDGRAHFAPIDENGVYTPYELKNITDRVGAGDAFCGALLFALVDPDTQQDLSKAVRFATAAGALCHSIPGDINFVSKEEVVSLASGVGSGRVKR